MTLGTSLHFADFRYAKINSIPSSLTSNSPQRIERLKSFGEKDTQVMNSNGKVIIIKTGSGILISNQQISEGAKKYDSRQITLVKTSHSGPSSPPTNSIPRGGFADSKPGKTAKPLNSNYQPPLRIASGVGPDGNDDPGNGDSWDDSLEETNVN